MRGFSQLNILDHRDIDPHPEAAKAYLKETIAQSEALSWRSLDRWRMTNRQERQLHDIFGSHQRTTPNRLASNGHLKFILGSYAIDRLGEMEAAHPNRRFMMPTLISDLWLSSSWAPTIWLGGMQRVIRQIMWRGNFDGWIGAIEIQTLDHVGGGFGRVLLPHFHAVAWTDDPHFSLSTAAKELCRSRRLISYIGAPTVTIVGHDATHGTNLGAYVFKGACIAKQRLPISDNGKLSFRFADAPLPPVAAVRQLEILSQIQTNELLLSGGAGKPLRQELMGLVREYTRRGSSREIDVDQAADIWSQLRIKSRARYQMPVIARTDGQLPVGCSLLQYYAHCMRR